MKPPVISDRKIIEKLGKCMDRKGPATPYIAHNLSLFLQATFAHCHCTCVEIEAVICPYELAHYFSHVALLVCEQRGVTWAYQFLMYSQMILLVLEPEKGSTLWRIGREFLVRRKPWSMFLSCYFEILTLAAVSLHCGLFLRNNPYLMNVKIQYRSCLFYLCW